MRAPSQPVTLLTDVNCPGSQEDMVRNWEPAHSLVEDAVSGAEIAPYLLALAVTHQPPCLWCRDGLVCHQLALLWYSLSPLFCEQARLRVSAFARKVLLAPLLGKCFYFLSLWLSHNLGCYLMLAPSVCPQGIQAWYLNTWYLLTLRTNDAAHASLSSPCSLVVDASV